MASKKVSEFNKEIKDKFSTLIVAAFGFVAALAWNEAILSVFRQYFGELVSIIAKFIYAIFVTVIAVIFTYSINKTLKKV